MKLSINASCFFCIKLLENLLMMSLNKWNQPEIYSEILVAKFWIQLKLMGEFIPRF
jgi:hypothetical protein